MDASVVRLEYSAHHLVDGPAQLSERGARLYSAIATRSRWAGIARGPYRR